jgi:hypothetical protein
MTKASIAFIVYQAAQGACKAVKGIAFTERLNYKCVKSRSICAIGRSG